MHAPRLFTALLLSATLATSGAAPTAHTSKPAPTAATNASTPTPYTMRGTVKNAAGKPLAGVEVWADNTLYYNMNALATTDAQGRYSIPLPHDQPGTWRAGGRFKAKFNGEWFELDLNVDQTAAFPSAAGAVRNFTLVISGEREGGGWYGGMVWPYTSGRGGDFEMDQVEFTLTPDGPLIDGSAGKPLKRFVTGPAIQDVPIGRYRVTARYVPKGGPAQAMLLLPRDADDWRSSVTITFRRSPQYGPFADFTVGLAPQP